MIAVVGNRLLIKYVNGGIPLEVKILEVGKKYMKVKNILTDGISWLLIDDYYMLEDLDNA